MGAYVGERANNLTQQDAGTSVYGTTLRHTLKQLVTSSFPLSSETRKNDSSELFSLGIEAHVVSSITAGCFSHYYCCAHTDSELQCAAPD